MVYFKEGADVTWMVTSASGRCVCTFTYEDDAQRWINERSTNGVRYKLFRRESQTTEIKHP